MNSDTNKNNERNRDSGEPLKRLAAEELSAAAERRVAQEKAGVLPTGVLESREDFVERMYQAMLDAGILKPKAD